MDQPYVKTQSVSKPEFLGGGNWIISHLGIITVLFGKNGSGKSLLLRAWRDIDMEGCHYIIPERTGEIDWDAGQLATQFDGQQRKSRSDRNFVDQYRRQIVARIHAYFSTRGGVRSGEAPGNPADLENFLSLLLPDFFVELKEKKNPPYRLVRVSDDSEVNKIDQLSSGEAQLLTVALDILTIAAIWDIEEAETRIMLIDEPDAHIHPDLQVRFADFLVQVAEKYKLQFVIATHSTAMLAALGQFGDHGTSVVYLNKQSTEIKAEKFTDVSREIAACLGGHVLMGSLFGVPVLLVEGDDDYRIWSQVPRYNQVNFAVIPCNGDEIYQYRKTLEKVFSALRDETHEPAGYALLDGDKPRPKPNNPQLPQNQMPFLQLDCHEAENLFLTDEVLKLLEIDWNEASKKILSEADKFGEKADALKAVATCDRKKGDIKSVIEQVSRILDEKNVHWTIRVAYSIGNERPSGHLGEFLGTELIDALWGVEKPEPEANSSSVKNALLAA